MFSFWQELPKCLGLTVEEMQVLKAQMENYHRVIFCQNHVQFENEETQTIAEFLSCFECQTSLVDTDRTASVGHVQILPNISETKKHRLGK